MHAYSHHRQKQFQETSCMLAFGQYTTGLTTFCMPYRIAGKFDWKKVLANLEIHKQFAKLKPSKFLLTIINFWLNLFIRQTFFAKCSKQVNSPNFTSTKLSCYTVAFSPIKLATYLCIHNYLLSNS